MAIYDCFQYFNEDHIVDLRLNVLDKFVDYFVISESTKTHQGKTKKLNSILDESVQAKESRIRSLHKKVIVHRPKNDIGVSCCDTISGTL